MQKIDWRDVSLLGIDVGFSATRCTTGIAVYRFGEPTELHCVGSRPDHRASVLTRAMRFDAIAVDGPMVPGGALQTPRSCERILSRGGFATRCKPGFSHFGMGLQLREATGAIAKELPALARRADTPIVEAFPNAFLAVMLDADTIDRLRPIPRGRKSDLYFREAVNAGAFARLLKRIGLDDALLLRTMTTLGAATTRASHDHRAAMICVLTAACALSGHRQAIGDDADGHIMLPPTELWSTWAHDALCLNS